MARLGRKIPNPVIKHSKKMGNTQYHFLSWEGEKGGEWVNEDFFDIFDVDGGHKTTTIEESCNTRKSRDKGTRAHTVGLFVEVKPCEIVCLFDEMYGCESIPQVPFGKQLSFFTIQAKKAS